MTPRVRAIRHRDFFAATAGVFRIPATAVVTDDARRRRASATRGTGSRRRRPRSAASRSTPPRRRRERRSGDPALEWKGASTALRDFNRGAVRVAFLENLLSSGIPEAE
jgi:hypothetical protein